jgi:hypothetical protein
VVGKNSGTIQLERRRGGEGRGLTAQSQGRSEGGEVKKGKASDLKNLFYFFFKVALLSAPTSDNNCDRRMHCGTCDVSQCINWPTSLSPVHAARGTAG